MGINKNCTSCNMKLDINNIRKTELFVRNVIIRKEEKSSMNKNFTQM